MSKELTNQTNQPDLEEIKESHTKIIQEGINQDQLNLTNKDNTHNEVYEYQSKSKLDNLSLWSKVFIIILLVLICIGAIIGTVFAITAAKEMIPK
ncbi:hypothetical protein [Mycoplasma bradburyae]|uniref:Uncharacterized protein n=1 Tax=Mycoplasma bradburyae TaxID=2963128 RepID=A0AAW6HNJ1_9MOLU|nr:hypothetical protein [Mycoplasma bradburyae]MDC4163420.1 hypothetical protein [Mycoplasma bradburyae]MDC4182036.1 hypothetical protein [Mycoplasma bradburyae]MDC4182734.1 hypothetical protein [Mycoplasma bradburyae]MDC4183407.1 hypothetical protein [Mycoplasma bradburyae]MDC4184218.1 hypothetical protein [Mycoplasma bradburyae]